MKEQQWTLYETWRGRDIRAQVTFLNEGIHVLVTGGDSSHVGAVSMCDREHDIQTMTFPEHKEALVTARWAEVLFDTLHFPVTVAAGIHYDRVCRSDLEEIVKTAEDLLEKVLLRMKGERE